jgi:hypothetical protein
MKGFCLLLAVILFMAAQIKKKNEYSYSNVTKSKYVPNLVQIPPPKNNDCWLLHTKFGLNWALWKGEMLYLTFSFIFSGCQNQER